MPETVPPSGKWDIPAEIREMDTWVIWDGGEKTPLAPWTTGDMYRAGWGDGVVADTDSRMTDRPETDFETVRRFAELSPVALHESHSFPNRNELPDRLLPTVILPHYPPDPPLMLVDFDDVRDPETGDIAEEARALIDRLGGFSEVSTSGTGVHTFIRAELPGSLGKFIGELETGGAVELYDHGRFVGCTWERLDDTPMAVPERQDLVEEIVERYETDAQQRRRTREPTRDVEATLAALHGSSGDRSPYFDIDIRAIADRGYFGRYRKDAPGNEWTGPHPEHGPVHSAPGDCTNFGIEPTQNVWNCFPHEGGAGGPLQLIAVLEGTLTCDGADLLHEDPEAMLDTCLAARDRYASNLDDVKPPYKALLGVAKRHDLQMAEDETLGKDCWRVCRKLYDKMGAQ